MSNMDYRRNEDRVFNRRETGGCAAFNAVLDVLFVEGSSPDVEPVTLAEALAQANIDNLGQDNALIEAYITTARIQCEGYTSIGFINRQVQAVVNNSLGGIYLPYGPIGEVSTVTNIEGLNQEFEVTGVQWKQLRKPLNNRLTVTYQAGYSELPELFKTALLQQVAYLYEHRGDESKVGELSPVAKSLLQPHRRV